MYDNDGHIISSVSGSADLFVKSVAWFNKFQ